MLTELGEAEERAETQLVHVVGQLKNRQPLWQQWQFMIPSGIAAILAIAVILIVTVPTGSPTSITNNTPPKPAASTQSTPRGSHSQTPVATLTATHNAAWSSPQAEGASAPGSNLSVGSPLHPNQRLTLTQGFAQITTNRGAIAILQAPATIELLNNDNAIRLHAGKLVGICETDSSKGFLVRTPHMDITDLGTVFGVDVSADGSTEAHVFDGKVRLNPLGVSIQQPPLELVRGQNVRFNASSGEFAVNTRSDTRFVLNLPVVINAPRAEGSIRFEPAMPISLGFNETEDDHIMLFAKHSGLRLNADQPVSIKPPDAGEPFASQSLIRSGTRVDTYLIHYDIPGSDPANGIRREATVRFARPVLGVIADGDALAQSHKTLGVQGVTYPGMKQSTLDTQTCGLDRPLRPDMQDHFQLSEDRRTLTVNLHASDSIDQLRVFIQAEGGQP